MTQSKNTIRKTIAKMLILAMILSILPVGVLAADDVFEFGSNNKKLVAGTYDVDVTLEGTGGSTSLISGVLTSSAKLIVASDGSASLALSLQSTTVYDMLTYITDVTYYQAYSSSGDAVDATDVAYDEETPAMVTKATVAINDTTEDGVYVKLAYVINTSANSASNHITIDYDSIDYSYVAPTLTAIEVDSTDHKTAYTVGDELDVSELTIELTYSDGNTETVAVTSDMVAGFNSSTANDTQVLTITYNDLTTDYTVSITEKSVIVPDDNDNSLADGVYSVPLYVAQYKYVFKDYGISDPESMANGALNSYATAYVSDGEITYTLQFKALELYSLRGHLTQVWTYPSSVTESETTLNYRDDVRSLATDLAYKTDVGLDNVIGSYMEYVTFDFDGDISENVYFQVDVDAMATAGAGIQQAVMVFDWDNAIEADNYIKSIAISSDNHKTAYELGEEIDVTNLTLDVSFYDATTITVPVTADMISGFDSSTDGVISDVTITYEGKTTSYVATVSNERAVTLTYFRTTSDASSGVAPYLPTTAIASKTDDGYVITVDAIDGFVNFGGINQEIDGSWVALETTDVSSEYDSGSYMRFEIATDNLQDAVVMQAYINSMAFMGDAMAWQSFRVLIDYTAPAPTATGITVNSSQHKTEYTVGDTLDADNLTLALAYDDGSTTTIAVTEDMVSGFDSSVIGTKELTITYIDFTTTFEVFFHAKATSGSVVEGMNDILHHKTDLFIENSHHAISAKFSSAAVEAIAGENDGSDVIITMAEADTNNLSEAQKDAIGDSTVFEFTVHVGASKVTHFDDAEVTITIPYTLGAHENAKGLVIWHIAEDGTIKPFSCTYDAVSETVTFVTTHFSIYTTAYDPSLVVSSISVSSTSHKTSYTVGDALDVSGLTIEATKEDGSRETIAVTADMVSGFNSSSATNSQVLTITYEDVTTTYTATITASSSSDDNSGSGSGGNSSDDEEFDGKYSVPVSVKKFMTTSTTYKSSSENSMADAAVLDMALADVDGDEITYTLWFTGIELYSLYGHLLEMWYYTAEDAKDGSLDDPIKADIETYFYDYGLEGTDGEKEKFPESISFTYEGSTDDIVYILVNVDAMATGDTAVGKQPAVLLFNWNKAESGSGATDSNTSGSSTSSGSSEEEVEEEISEEELQSIAEAIEVFSDVTENDWFAAAVAYVITNELFNGTSDTDFSPNADMTRAMLMTVLHRISGDDSFADGEQWFTDGMNWAVEMGISDGSNPEDSITREQLVTMIYRFANGDAVESELSVFEDLADVSDWASQAMAWAYETALLTGKTETRLAPQDTATRAEVATIIMRYLSSLEDEDED